MVRGEWESGPRSSLPALAKRAAERFLREINSPATDTNLCLLLLVFLDPDQRRGFLRQVAVAIEIKRREATGEWRD